MSHPSDTPHSAHVESRSRKALRSYIIQAATLLEIVLSAGAHRPAAQLHPPAQVDAGPAV